MSRITLNIRCNHRDTGMTFQSSTAYDAGEDGVLLNSIEINDADETIDFSELINPKAVLFRLMGGDDLLVGLSATPPYPFLLSGVGDTMILRLNTDNLNEQVAFTTGADSSGSLDGDHIELREFGDTKVWPYFSVSDQASGTITYATPSAATGASGTIVFTSGIEVAQGQRAYAMVGAYDSGVVAPNTAISDGDTMTIGSRTYTFKTTLTGALNEILIYPSMVSSNYSTWAPLVASNICDAINQDPATRGTAYSYDTLPHEDVSAEVAANGYCIAPYTTNGSCVILTARDSGTAANSISLSTTVTDLYFDKQASYPHVAGNAYSGTSLMVYGTDGSTVTVGTDTFTSVEPQSDIGSDYEFENIYDLESKLAIVSGVTISRNYLTITVTATDTGTAGNSIALAKSGADLTVSGSYLSGGNSATSVTVDDTTFTYKASSPGLLEFDSIATLTTKIDALSGLSASNDGTDITIVVDTPGTAGNSIVLTKSGAGTTSVSGSGTLAGGTAGASAPTAPYTTERLISVPVVTDSTAAQVAAALQAAVDADSAYTATVAGNVVTITDINTGARTDATEGDTGWAAPSVTDGAAVSAVHVMSKGASQVLIQVIPK